MDRYQCNTCHVPQVDAKRVEDPQGKLILSIDKLRHLRLGSVLGPAGPRQPGCRHGRL